MISPFEVYLVMQLDKIVFVCTIMAVVTLVCGFLTFGEGVAENNRTMRVSGGAALATGVFSVLLATLLPSTKTAAAMLILPAITSDEVVKPLGNEARELYDLAKDALRKAVDAPAPKTTTPEKSDVE